MVWHSPSWSHVGLLVANDRSQATKAPKSMKARQRRFPEVRAADNGWWKNIERDCLTSASELREDWLRSPPQELKGWQEWMDDGEVLLVSGLHDVVMKVKGGTCLASYTPDVSLLFPFGGSVGEFLKLLKNTEVFIKWIGDGPFNGEPVIELRE